MYIRQHPGRYVLPASHNKVYISWRLPDVFDQDLGAAALLAIQERILLKMIQSVRQDLFTEMRSRTMRLPYHTDSTTGITSTLDSQCLDETSSFQRLYLEDLEQPLDEKTESNTSEDEDGDGGVRI